MNKKLGRLLKPGVGIYYVVLVAFAAAAAVLEQFLLSGIILGVTALLLTMHLVMHSNRRKNLKAFLEARLGELEAKRSLAPFPMVAFRLADKGVVFANDTFIKLTGFQDTMTERNVTQILPGLKLDWLAAGKTEYPYDVTLGRRRYRVYGTTLQANDPAGTWLGALYFTDLTELYQVRDEYIRSRPVVSIILVDNYEELNKNLTEAATATLNARINETITEWTEGYHGLLRRLERNRFLFIFEKKDLKQAIADKFSLLENIHDVTNPSGLAASISMGLGVDAETYEEAYEFAALSIEMALSRGGDQAVIKDRVNFDFYGGRNRESEHRSKVRSRVTANSMMELIGQSSQVFIMGHKNADMDAVGAAVGIACLCRKKGKPFYIVLDLQQNASGRLIDELRQVPDYKNVFISAQEALLLCDNRSTLVVVDTNRPD